MVVITHSLVTTLLDRHLFLLVLISLCFLLQLAESSQQSSFACDVDGCTKICKTKGGIKRHRASKHPDVVLTEKQKIQEELDKTAKDRLGPCDLKNLIKESASHLAEDTCFPSSFRDVFIDFEMSEEKSKELFELLKEMILKFKPSNTDVFLEKFRRIAVSFNLMNNKRASFLLMMELSNKCITHMTSDGAASTSQTVKTKLSEKEGYVLQYITGHVIRKLYVKLRKSKNWSKSKFQQAIQLLKSFKIDATASYKLVQSRDRGGLWYCSMDSVRLFEQAELNFLKKTVGHVTRIDYRPMVQSLMKNDVVKLYWQKLVDSSLLSIEKDVGKDLLEQMFGLYMRIRSFSYAKDIREKHKRKTKQGKKRSLRNELELAEQSEL